MKLRLNPNRKEAGLVWALILFVVVLLVILGVIVYFIWKWSKLPPPNRGMQLSFVTSTTDPNVVKQITGQDPPTTNTASKAATLYADSTTYYEATSITIERSTNMMSWEDIFTLDAATTVNNVFQYDTNPPPDRAFYRFRYNFAPP